MSPRLIWFGEVTLSVGKPVEKTSVARDTMAGMSQQQRSAPTGGVETPSALAGFGAPTRTWFESVFTAPTPAQAAAWGAIRSGHHALVIAPTGSGKTLAAFLHSLDRLSKKPNQGKVRVLYISPLKALAVDVEHNLRAPLRGIAATAERLGLTLPEVRVALRSGDTPASDRRSLLTHPSDILITTPESLFLMLSSQVASTLDEIETVIVDEVHALAGTKRGAHLMLSLERLDAMNQRGEAQRIGLSATIRPPDRVARFLGGDRPVEVISPATHKNWDLRVKVPLDDMTELGSPPCGEASAPPSRSIWPHIEAEILDAITAHRSTICFVNSRRVAERLTAHLNELYAAKLGAVPVAGPPPAQLMAQSSASKGFDGTEFPVVARAHHGSVSKQRRAEIEAELKSGRLSCVVATSSLELGIDMGAVDLVIQVACPPSVASGLQRVGRAGHQVGVVSKGLVFPISRADLLESAVVAQRMVAGQIEEVHQLRNPLDVLAQHLVSMCVDASPTSQEVFELVRRADPFRGLSRAMFDSVLDMLTGRYPSEDFAELRPRLIWDRSTDILSGRAGGRRLVSTSGGTIPDRGLFGVFLVGEQTAAGKHEPGRRVGELDEEMVYESRVGDVFTLGTTSWLIEQITPSQVLVSPAPGQPGRLPFWHGDAPARPAELGRAIGDFVHQLSSETGQQATERLAGTGLDSRAATNLVSYLAEQHAATGTIPDASTIVVERFRDELGDWRVCIHCALGLAVLQPWSLVIERAAREKFGVEARATATNDGIILHLPDVDAVPPDSSLLMVDPSDVEQIVTDQVFGSPLFAARFRECAARALLLPRRDPGQRSPLWQQRLRSAQLLSVASGYPDFPIVLETMRECLEDVFDLPALINMLRDIAARKVHLVDVETEQASPFARSLLFGYVGEFVYDADQPLAERKLAALSLDPSLLAELLGHEPGSALLDPDVVAHVDAELQHVAPDRQAGNAEQLWDLLRTIGPLTRQECLARCSTESQAESRAEQTSENFVAQAPGSATELTNTWLAQLAASRRIAEALVNGMPMFAVAQDYPMLAAGLGVPLPAELAFSPHDETLDAPDMLGRLVQRWCRQHSVSTASDIASRYGLAVSTVEQHLSVLVSAGTLVKGRFTDDASSEQFMHQQVLSLVKRRTLARLRSQVEPVTQQTFARFLLGWQDICEPPAGMDALVAAVDQLAGYPIPASTLEAMILPARVRDYRPAMLDELLSNGDVVWTGHGAIGRQDGWVQLWPADLLLSPEPNVELSDTASAVLARLAGGGSWRIADLAGDDLTQAATTDALWELAWAGMVTTDTFAVVRALSSGGSLKKPRTPRPTRRATLAPHRRNFPPSLGGRWSAVPNVPTEPGSDMVNAINLELGRYGVLTRGSVLTETMTPSFSDAYRVLASSEECGITRRGYFVDGLGVAQFALPGAVDRLRAASPAAVMLLAACDPANPWGAALPWPPTQGHRPARKAGALVVLDDGCPVCYIERGAHTLLSFEDTSMSQLATALSLVCQAVQDGRVSAVTIERINGQPALAASEFRESLQSAGFAMVPQGFKCRRRVI